MKQVEIIKVCLDFFLNSSRQRVSQEKTEICFSKNVHYSRASEIAQAFEFSLSSDLGKYLGVPLHHKRTSSRSFSYVTNKLLHRLFG